MREHNVTTLSRHELEHARRELAASLALARPGSPARVPILAQLAAIDAELAGRLPGLWPEPNRCPASPADTERITRIIRECPRWSVFWDKRYRVWRAAEDDPDSDLYAESPDAYVVIQYITEHC